METIEITIPETKIIISEEELNFNVLEEKIWQATMKQGRKALENTLPVLDRKIAKERGKGFENQGLKDKYLGTMFGDIYYSRRGYYDKEGKLHYLLDEKLGLEKNQRVSVFREKLEATLGFEAGSYRKAENLFKLLLCSSRSFESIRQTVQRVGNEIRKEEELEAEAILEGKEEIKVLGEPQEFAFLEADGTYIHLQGEKKKRGEVKLGIGYLGWDKRYPKGERKAYELQHKFIYGGIEAAEKFTEKLSILAEKNLGLSKVKQLIIGGDGANWIRETLLDLFPEATYQLSKYHLNRRLKETLFYDKALEKGIKGLLKRDKVDEATSLLEKELQKNKGDKKKTRELIVYLKNNREGINGIARIKKSKKLSSFLRSTGAIEGNIDKTICHRLKKHGMRWGIAGAENILKVATKILNGQWDEWWREKKHLNSESLMLRPQKKSFRKVLGKANHDIWITYCEREIPTLHGPHQGRSWIERLRDKIYDYDLEMV